ncbi:TrbC/VirB2 family protein [Acidovorax sp. LjRoot129]|uniref:TrbC/VirB2 family protein n=1 Tax=Acidovorax sp. LjRoot129 TaxID=3342260 RepID=UPI003ECC6A37
MLNKLKLAYNNNAIAKREISGKTLTFILMAMIALVSMMPDAVMAEPWDSTAQKVLDIFNSGLARLLAIIAVIACGIAALAGRLSWDWAIKIVIGLVLIFGATAIVDYIIAAAKG